MGREWGSKREQIHFYPEPSCKVWLLTMCMLFSLRKTHPLHFCLYNFFLYRVYKEMGKYPGKDKCKAPTKIWKPRNTDRHRFYHGLCVILNIYLSTCILLSPKNEKSGFVCTFNSRAEDRQPRVGLWHRGVGWGRRRPEDRVTRFRHHPSENRTRVTCNAWSKKE